MTEENLAGEEVGVAADDNSPDYEEPRVASQPTDPVSGEPKGYPDVAETDSGARQEQSVSGEEEDFLSE
jgi:hypothetical protein